MPLVPAICTQCGAQIEVDDSHEAGICKHCGTAFITEKAINNYATYVTNNNIFNGATIIQEDGFQKLVNAAEGYLKLGDLVGAKTTYQNMINDYPQKFEGWYGLWCLEIEDEKKNVRVTKKPLTSVFLENAKKLASYGQMVMINTTMEDLMSFYKESVEIARKRFNSRFDTFEEFAEYVEEFAELRLGNKDYDNTTIYYENGNIIYDKIIVDSLKGIKKSYVYTMVGYDSKTNRFILSNNVKVYDYANEKWNLIKELKKCNIELYAEDFNENVMAHTFHIYLSKRGP